MSGGGEVVSDSAPPRPLLSFVQVAWDGGTFPRAATTASGTDSGNSSSRQMSCILTSPRNSQKKNLSLEIKRYVVSSSFKLREDQTDSLRRYELPESAT